MTLAIATGPNPKIIIHLASLLNEKLRNFIARKLRRIRKEPDLVNLFNLTHHSLEHFLDGLTGRID
jgi:hypothetical protein